MPQVKGDFNTNVTNNYSLYQLPTISRKSWKLSRLFCQDQDQGQDFYFKTKTKTLFFVLEAPRDHDLGLEDYITG